MNHTASSRKGEDYQSVFIFTVRKAQKHSPIGTDASLPLTAGAKSDLETWLQDFVGFVKSELKVNFKELLIGLFLTKQITLELAVWLCWKV